MNLVLQHIEYLMSTHDCVVVPGLGAFLARDCSAEYFRDEELFVAPSRKFTFNRDLNVSDGLLEMSIARALSMKYETAAQTVDQAVDSIMKELDAAGECTIGRLGRLEKNSAGEISFVGYPTDYLTALSGWLGSISISEMSRHTKKLNQNPYTGRSGYDRPRHGRVSRHFKSALGAAAAILIALVVSTPVAVKNTYKASTTPTITAPHSVEVPVATPVEEVKIEHKEEANTPEVISEKAQKPVAVKQEKKSDSVMRFDDSDPYILVVASLTSREDADKFIAQHSSMKGVEFGVDNSGRYHRVYVATGASSSDVMAAYANSPVSGRFDGAWPTRR